MMCKKVTTLYDIKGEITVRIHGLRNFTTHKFNVNNEEFL